MTASAIAALALKDLRQLARDRRAAVILLLMPVVFVLVLGISVEEGFGQKPDDRLRVTVVNLDQGFAGYTYSPDADPTVFPGRPWSQVMLEDMAGTAAIRVERLDSLQAAQQLVRDGQRSAVIVFGPKFSDHVHRCSFLRTGINPFYRDGVELARIDAEILRDPTQLGSASIIEQVAQVSVLRVILPWMIGRAFDDTGRKLGGLGTSIIKNQFPNYDLTAKTWASLTKQDPRPSLGPDAIATASPTPPAGILHRGSYRYQILVPSYTVMFSFFLVLTTGWLFASERREGTLTRLRLAPISRGEILIGKLIPCIVISVGQGVFLLVAGRLLFGMNWGARPDLLFTVALCTSLAATGLALLAAGTARTEAQVMVYGTLLVLVMASVSGCLMPRELMPEAIRQASRVTPHAWALDAYAQLLLNPEPNVALVLRSCAALLGFAGLFLALAWTLTRIDD